MPDHEKQISQKKRTSRLHQTHFSGLQFLSCGQCVKYSISHRNGTLQRASRLSKTYLFNKLHFPTNVSSTPNAHVKKQMSSRLRQMLMFLKNGVSPTQNTYFGQRIAPSGAIEDNDCCDNNCKCMRPVYVKHTLPKTALSNECLVYTKCTFEKASVVSSTPDATFFEKKASRLHQTLTLEAEPSRAE